MSRPGSFQRLIIGGSLELLALAGFTVVNAYCLRFRQPDARPFPFSSWQSQTRAFALLAALPLCSPGLLFILPAGALPELTIPGVLLLAYVVSFIAHLWTADSITSPGHLARISQWRWAQ